MRRRGYLALAGAVAALGSASPAWGASSTRASSAAVSAAVASAQASAAAAAAGGAAGGSALGRVGASGSPLTPGLPQSTVSSTTTSTAPLVPTSTSAGDSGLSGGTAVAIGIGALVVLAGISFYIWRDARRRAPVGAHAHAPVSGAGSKRPQKPRKLSPAERRRRKRGRAR